MIRDDAPAPMPDWCRGRYARAIYGAAVAAAERCPGLIWFDSEVAKMAANLAMLAQAYIQNPLEEPEEREAKRLVLRAMLADFLLLDADEVDAPGTILPNGMDADIAAACGVQAVQ